MEELWKKTAASLFESTPWPSPEEEEWRRTWLEKILPPGVLDQAARGGRPPLPQDEEDNEPLPEAALPEGYSARVVTQGPRVAALALSEEFKKSGAQLRWRPSGDLPPGMSPLAEEELDNPADRVTAWHWLDLPGVLELYLPPGAQLKAPLLVEEMPGTGAVRGLPHVHVEAGAGSSAEILWSLTGGNEAFYLVNAGLTGNVGKNARLRVFLRQVLGAKAGIFLHGRIRVQQDAQAEITETHLGGVLVKTRLRMVLQGQGAHGGFSGIFAASKGRHLDIGSVQEHKAPRTTSNALYKGALYKGGRGIYQGLITVGPQAAKTDAYLKNQNLLLEEGGRVDSIPKLNILTDDVKCSHGSTTGKIPEDQLFYLISRGFSLKEAKKEILRGFLGEILHNSSPPLREMGERDLDEVLS